MTRYYELDGAQNKEVFEKRLQQIHQEIENGIDDLKGLISVRNKLYRLKRKYEECGCRFLECEYEIMALNELIEEERQTVSRILKNKGE